MKTRGIHHITGIAGDAQRNLDFYAGILGLRFIKKTVNFDDPYTYHFYFGNEAGEPGTILTFFPWSSEGKPGRRGVGQTESFAFSVPAESMGYWQTRLVRLGVTILGVNQRFGDPVLRFEDSDGAVVELVAREGDERLPWAGVVPSEHAIRGFHSVTLLEAAPAPTGAFLREHLGMVEVGTEGNRIRFSPGGSAGAVDLAIQADLLPGQWGRGTIHHIAFSARDDEQQQQMREALLRSGVSVTPVADRQYFRSIYFHEPGGVLFEVATDGPGFTIDESVEGLGSDLKLPPWYEEGRKLIEQRLPFVIHPESTTA